MRQTANKTTPLNSNSFGSRLSQWEPDANWDRCIESAAHINREYDALRTTASHGAVSYARLERSLWAKRSLSSVIARLPCTELDSFGKLLDCVEQIRGTLDTESVNALWQWQQNSGNARTAIRLTDCLVKAADVGSELVRTTILALGKEQSIASRLGPPVDSRFRPIRKTGRQSQHAWLQDPKYTNYEFIDGNPDHIRFRGLELKSGDIGIVELNSPGDGILESFLNEPGLAPHAMLFITRRVVTANGEVLFQPSLLEIFEEGWRTIPLSTGLSRRFTWYSEWIRPPRLPDNIGEGLSRMLDGLGAIAFDFQARRAPTLGDFSTWEQPCATCTNLIRIPFEMLGISLPYATTLVNQGARENLARIGLGELEEVHTPTNILVDACYQSVGMIDNGQPEWSIAQAMVLGCPAQLHSFGGYFSGRELQIQNLPDWRSVTNWRSAWESAKIALGQSRSLVASLACQIASFSQQAIPRSASPTAIAFYLRSAMESGYIVSDVVVPELRKKLNANDEMSVEELQNDEELLVRIQVALSESSLEREGWYSPL